MKVLPKHEKISIETVQTKNSSTKRFAYLLSIVFFAFCALIQNYYFTTVSLSSLAKYDDLGAKFLKQNVSHAQLELLDCFTKYVKYRGGINEIHRDPDLKIRGLSFACDFQDGLDFEMLFPSLHNLEQHTAYDDVKPYKLTPENLISIYWDYQTRIKLADNFENEYLSVLPEKEKNISFKVSSSILLHPKEAISKCSKVCALTLEHIESTNDVYKSSFQRLRKKIPQEYLNRYFLFRYGDHTTRFYDRPVIAKALNVNERKYTIPLYLNYLSHYRQLNQLSKSKFYYDKSFTGKFPVAIWSGATTGYGNDNSHNPRFKLVETYFDKNINYPLNSMEHAKNVVLNYLGLYQPTSKIDVCFSKLVQHATLSKELKEYYSQLVCPKKSMRDMLQYRYLISVEGNDVATGLKWMLYSNSVVLMPPPTKETRFREGSLVPWLHYVPLAEDFTDLIEKIRFCDNHISICQKVAEMATEFAKQRMIGQEEADDINAALFKEYLDTHEIKIVDKTCDVEVDCIE